MRWFYFVCRGIAVTAGRIFMHGPIVGAENLPRSGPFLIAPLHRSDIDFLMIARITRRRMRFIAKSGIFVNRQFNWLIETLGAFPVDRQATDREAFNRALQILIAGEPLVIFPKGPATRVRRSARPARGGLPGAARRRAAHPRRARRHGQGAPAGKGPAEVRPGRLRGR